MSIEHVTLRQRVRYSFDNSMSRGPIALVGWLALVCAVVILGMAVMLRIFELAPAGISPLSEAKNATPGLLELIWIELLRTLDPGTMGADRGDWSFLVSMLATTLLGIFAISVLIGVLTSSIEGKMRELSLGRSRVLERNHTLILGWSAQVFDIVHQVSMANLNQKKSSIVVMAERDMREMSQEINLRIPDLRNTRVICRTGNPIDIVDLEIVNPGAAKSIVILQPEIANPDAHVIKTILALTKSPRRKTGSFHIVADIRSPEDVTAARLVGGNEICPVITCDIVSGIIVQTCRQSGLSMVFQELLSFDGSEIYVHAEPSLRGQPFGEALFAFPESCVLGLKTPSGVRLNPPSDTIVGPDDDLIIIARDDDTTTLAPKRHDGRSSVFDLIEQGEINETGAEIRMPESTLILGWNHRVPIIVKELEGFLEQGSRITIATSGDRDALAALLPSGLQRVCASVVSAEISSRPVLDQLDICQYDQIVVLPYSDDMSIQSADAISLVALLHLRDIIAGCEKAPRVVTEMLDLRNRELAEVTGADDYVVSSHLTSLMIAQISESQPLCEVFDELLHPRGNEISLKPAGHYVAENHETTFATVIESARRRGQVAIGYRTTSLAREAQRGYGVVINPPKSARITLGAADRVIVISEN